MYHQLIIQLRGIAFLRNGAELLVATEHALFLWDVITGQTLWLLHAEIHAIASSQYNPLDEPLIVAAVECNAGANNERLVEYSPYRFDDKQYGHFDGKGKDTLNWFVHEFKPYIDANYRTEPDRDHTFIGGSSMGGLMSLYALLQYSDVFGRAAALSPSLWVAPEALTALGGRCKLAPGTVLYMDYGSREMGNHDGMRCGFAEKCAKVKTRGIHLTSRIVPGGTHSEASWEKQLPFVFHTLMYELD